MKTFSIKINTIDEVKKFVSTVMKYDYDIDVVSGRYAIDAKSIMGIFSLDLSKNLTLNLHTEDTADIEEELKDFIV